MKKILLLGAALCVLPFSVGAATIRPAVGKPLQQAEALMQKQDYRAALLKVDQASAVTGLTADESLVIAQVRGAAAAGAGEYQLAARSYQAVLASGTEPPATQTQLIQAIAGFYDEAQDYPHTIIWVNRYIAAQGSDPATRALLAQSYYQEGDYKSAEAAAWREQNVASTAGRVLPESELQLLSSAAQKNGDTTGYQTALETLLRNYPNPQYWNQAISLIAAAPGFPDGLTLDVYRLRLATGTLTAPADYEDYTERAILAGRPVEANHVIEAGFSANILNGQTDSGHAARLKTLAEKQSQNAVDKPVTDALGPAIADYNAGANGAAIKQFESIPAYANPNGDPAASLARLWVIYLQNQGAKQ